MHGKHIWGGDGERHRREIPIRIIGHLLEQLRIDHDVGRNDDERVSIRRRSCPLSHPDIAARTPDIFDIKLCAELV